MSKLLLAFSVSAMLYGNCAFGMDYDENELYENPWKDSNLDPLKEKVDKNAEKSAEKNLSTQKLKELLDLEREKVKKYEQALQKSQQLLAEEREKNRQSETQEQRVQTEESDQLLNDFNSKLNLQTDEESSKKFTSELEPQKIKGSETKKGFKFKNFNAQHPEILFNMGAKPESGKTTQVKRRINRKTQEPQPNFVLVENKTTPKQPQDQLIEAIKKGNLADVSNAIKNGATVKTTNALIIACWSGNLEIIRYLVKHGANVNKVRNDDGVTPLLIAAQEGYGNIVKFLVEHGADINKAENNEQTPLYTASMNGHFEIVKFLIEHGADINKTNIWKNTPLHAAFFNKHETVIKYLMKHGADINAKNILGLTPLQSTELSNMLLGENNRNKRKEAK